MGPSWIKVICEPSEGTPPNERQEALQSVTDYFSREEQGKVVIFVVTQDWYLKYQIKVEKIPMGEVVFGEGFNMVA